MKPKKCLQSMIDRLMKHRVSGWTALWVALAFTVVAIVIGGTDAIPEEVRAGIAFPVLLAGMIIGLRDVLTHSPVRWETVATALLATFGSVIVGYQSTADAKQSSVLAILILSVAVIALAVLVSLLANWLTSGKRQPFVRAVPLVEKNSQAADEEDDAADQQS